MYVPHLIVLCSQIYSAAGASDADASAADASVAGTSAAGTSAAGASATGASAAGTSDVGTSDATSTFTSAWTSAWTSALTSFSSLTSEEVVGANFSINTTISFVAHLFTFGSTCLDSFLTAFPSPVDFNVSMFTSACSTAKPNACLIFPRSSFDKTFLFATATFNFLTISTSDGMVFSASGSSSTTCAISGNEEDEDEDEETAAPPNLDSHTSTSPLAHFLTFRGGKKRKKNGEGGGAKSEKRRREGKGKCKKVSHSTPKQKMKTRKKENKKTSLTLSSLCLFANFLMALAIPVDLATSPVMVSVKALSDLSNVFNFF